MLCRSLVIMVLALSVPEVAFAAAQEPEGVEAEAFGTPLEVRADEIVRLLNGATEPQFVFTKGF